jgi:hypothetical protein
MGSESLLVLVVLLGLLVVAGLARRHFATGWQRNALSVTLVVLALFTAFLLFFAAGSLVRGIQRQAGGDGVTAPIPERFALSAQTVLPLQR